jgi:ketosteroid isomerase-like protein
MELAAATVDAFHAALRRGDTLSALFLIADDGLVFEDGRAERKAEYAARHLAADAAFSKAVSSEMIDRRGDATPDGLAWIATQTRARGRFRGTKVDRVGVETMVLRRLGATWQIVNIHWSSAPSAVE